MLNLGAGVQSTTVALMFEAGEIPQRLDAAIFADTQEEPEAVYRHLDWLRKTIRRFPILTVTAGKLGDDLISRGNRFVGVPVFSRSDGSVGQLRRQCSKDYKIVPIKQAIREMLGLRPKQRVPKSVRIFQYFGISAARANCLEYLSSRVPHRVPRSSCICCPYHSDAEWVQLKTADLAGWKRAVDIDRALRAIKRESVKGAMYLHRSCVPLEEVTFDTAPTARDLQMALSFWGECEGVCGL